MTQIDMETAKQAGERITIQRNGLTMECFFTGKGKLQRKIEYWDGKCTESTYQFDNKGHLLNLSQDGIFAEGYKYNQAGQRIEQRRAYRGFSGSTAGFLYYDAQGKIAKAGDTSFYYDKRGSLGGTM
jgi:YD repeat-containing protein